VRENAVQVTVVRINIQAIQIGLKDPQVGTRKDLNKK
jgi:hypothetical protein